MAISVTTLLLHHMLVCIQTKWPSIRQELITVSEAARSIPPPPPPPPTPDGMLVHQWVSPAIKLPINVYGWRN